MTPSCLGLLLLATTPGPARLVLPEGAGTTRPLNPWVLALLAGLVAFGLSLLVLVLIARWWRGLEPEERAFRRLASAMRVSRSQRHALREIASAHGVVPVAVLLCPRGVMASPSPGTPDVEPPRHAGSARAR